MKLCWFNDDRLGLVVGGYVLDVTLALAALPARPYPAPLGDLLISHLDVVLPVIANLQGDASRYGLANVHLRSAVARPTKIIGVPVNYSDHVNEAKSATTIFKQYEGSIEDQGLFLKATSSLIGCSDGVQIHFPNRPTHHEIELAVIIGKSGKNIPEADAFAYVAGYAVALDMTLRGSEDRSFRKSIDTYSVLGPWFTTMDEIANPQCLEFRLQVNGETRQQSNTENMIMGIAQQIAWASSFYQLLPGDIIMTGTSAGVGPVQAGDTIHAAIEGLGSMRVAVR